MLSKILKKLGYVKVKEEVDEETQRKLKKLKKDFTNLMSYSIEKSVKGENDGKE